MTEDVRHLVLGLLAVVVSAALGWLLRTQVWKRKLRRKQAFFGLPANSESLLVVNREATGPELTVTRHDVFSLLELAALIKDCGAHSQVVGGGAPGAGGGGGRRRWGGPPAGGARPAPPPPP
ncbi:hypothetical protein ACFVZ2_20350, partial [Streptomyces lasiicapitis]